MSGVQLHQAEDRLPKWQTIPSKAGHVVTLPESLKELAKLLEVSRPQ